MKARWGWQVLIAGSEIEPDPNLLAHAREIASAPREFHETIREFLTAEASRFRGLEQEVQSLKLDEVKLCWPKQLGDGMIYFDGGRDYRVWRCDYIDRAPRSLGFDT
jgi:hypothetical protein